MNRNKIFPLVAVIGILLLIAIVWWWRGGQGGGLLGERWTGVEGQPMNITLDFYEDWLEARRAGDNEPFTRGLPQYEQIGGGLRDRLMGFEGKLAAGETDPVLCQSELPEGLRATRVYEQEEAAQVLVTSTTDGQTGQAIVKLAAKNGLWQISDITCGNGEQGPQGEFSFDRTGFLLKQVPPPLNADYWHLVFEEDGVLGHAVPLYINSDSVCVAKDGATSACDDTILKETIPAHVLGEMSESGVQVKRIELVESVNITE